METWFYNNIDDTYWCAVGLPAGGVEELIAGYPEGTTQIAAPPSGNFSYNGSEWVENEPELPTPAELIAAFTTAIEQYVDGVAVSFRYKDAMSFASYATSTNALWSAQATAFVAWRDAVWLYAYNEMDKVLNAERALPSVPELIAELPVPAIPSAL